MVTHSEVKNTPTFLIILNQRPPPDGRIGENDFIKSICTGPWHAYQFSSLACPEAPIYDICLFYPKSFNLISPLKAFSEISGFPLQLPPISPYLVGI